MSRPVFLHWRQVDMTELLSTARFAEMSNDSVLLYLELAQLQFEHGSISANGAAVRALVPGRWSSSWDECWKAASASFLPSGEEGRLADPVVAEERLQAIKIAETNRARTEKARSNRWSRPEDDGDPSRGPPRSAPQNQSQSPSLNESRSASQNSPQSAQLTVLQNNQIPLAGALDNARAGAPARTRDSAARSVGSAPASPQPPATAGSGSNSIDVLAGDEFSALRALPDFVLLWNEWRACCERRGKPLSLDQQQEQLRMAQAWGSAVFAKVIGDARSGLYAPRWSDGNRYLEEQRARERQGAPLRILGKRAEA